MSTWQVVDSALYVYLTGFWWCNVCLCDRIMMVYCMFTWQDIDGVLYVYLTGCWRCDVCLRDRLLMVWCMSTWQDIDGVLYVYLTGYWWCAVCLPDRVLTVCCMSTWQDIDGVMYVYLIGYWWCAVCLPDRILMVWCMSTWQDIDGVMYVWQEDLDYDEIVAAMLVLNGVVVVNLAASEGSVMSTYLALSQPHVHLPEVTEVLTHIYQASLIHRISLKEESKVIGMVMLLLLFTSAFPAACTHAHIPIGCVFVRCCFNSGHVPWAGDEPVTDTWRDCWLCGVGTWGSPAGAGSWVIPAWYCCCCCCYVLHHFLFSIIFLLSFFSSTCLCFCLHVVLWYAFCGISDCDLSSSSLCVKSWSHFDL